MTERPQVICEHCFDAQRKSYLSEFMLYCEHSRTLVGRSDSGPWHLQQNVSRADMELQRAVAIGDLMQEAAARGYTLEQAESVLQKQFESKRSRL
jgi:hypothetical protein